MNVLPISFLGPSGPLKLASVLSIVDFCKNAEEGGVNVIKWAMKIANFNHLRAVNQRCVQCLGG